jgi:hypothetical protein
MINRFKFLQSNDKTILDEDWYWNYEPYVPDNPPEGISRRHWNMMPRELRDGPIEDMEVYIRGWEAARDANYNNPHINPIPAELWNRGWHAWWERRNRTGQNFRNVNPNPPIDETYPEYYNIEDFDFHDVSEVRYDEETYVPYKVMLMRSVVSGNIVEGQRIIYGHPMYNFPDII